MPLGALFRFLFIMVSKTFSKLFGLATITFFGRMPSRDDDKVAAVGLLSVAWITLPIGVLIPEVAEALIPFLPDDESVVRWTAGVLTVVVPPVAGFLTATIENHRYARRSTTKQVLKGYLYAPVIAGMVIALVIVVPIVKAKRLAKIKEVEHLAVMVRRGDLDIVVDEVVAALERAGTSVSPRKPNPAIAWVFRYLTWVEANIFQRDMTLAMRMLDVRRDAGEGGDEEGEGEDHVEVIVHATDIGLVGRRDHVAFVLAVLCEELSEEHLYFTWDEPAQQLEDRILELRHGLDRGEDVDLDDVLALRDQLRGLGLNYEAWNSVRRHLYALERDVFRSQVERLPTYESVEGAAEGDRVAGS